MKVRPIADPLSGEHVLRLDPDFDRASEADFRRRPNLGKGRALSGSAFEIDQRERSMRLALRGQMVSPGVVKGLEARLEPGGKFLLIGPGLGLTATGEDVVVPWPMRVALDELPVPNVMLTAVMSHVEAFVPQEPVEAHLGGLIAAPRVGFVVLQPIRTRSAPAPALDAGGAIDPTSYAYDDRQIGEGCRVVLFVAAADDLAAEPAKWRNRLAHAIFEAERAGGAPDDGPALADVARQAMREGVLVGVIGFTADRVPVFLDRASVVRTAGVARPRTSPSLSGPRGGPRLWQARIAQLDEQMAGMPPSRFTNNSAIQDFDFLPPVGRLPKGAIDFMQWTGRFFPPQFVVDAAPVPLEQLDAIVAACASLDPLDTKAAERVRVLIPVPQAYWEPRLLVDHEVVDASFDQAITDALVRVDELLARRLDLREKRSLLGDAIEGTRPDRFPAVDRDAVDGEAPSVPPDPPEAAYGVEDGVVTEMQELLEGSFAPIWVFSTPASYDHVASVVAIDRGDGAVEVLATSANNDEVSRATFDKSLGSWVATGQRVNSRLAAVTRYPGHIDVFARGVTDNELYQSWYEGGWHDWSSLTDALRSAGHSGKISSDPIAVSSGRDRIDLFAVGPLQVLWHAFWDGNRWHSWRSLGATLASDGWDGHAPKFTAAVSPSPGRVDLFAVASDGKPWHAFLDGDTWHAWEGLNGTLAHQPVPVVSRPGVIDVFVRGTDDGLYHGRLDDRWSGWERLGTGVLQSSPAVIAQGEGVVDVFVRGTNAGLYYGRYDGGWRELTWLLSATYADPVAAPLAGGGALVLTRSSAQQLAYTRAVPRAGWSQVKRVGLNGVVSFLVGAIRRARDAVNEARTRIDQAQASVQGLKAAADAQAAIATYTYPYPQEIDTSGTAIQAWTLAKQAKRETCERLAAIDLDVGAIVVTFPSAPSLLPFEWLEAFADPNRSSRVRDRIDSEKSPAETIARPPPPPQAVDATFTRAFARIQDARAVIDAVSGRIGEYDQILAATRSALGRITPLTPGLDARLVAIDIDLGRARRDVVIARAARADEQARLDELNARRKQTREERVPFLVFHRPRTQDLLADTPAQTLAVGDVSLALPQGVADPASSPPALHAMIDLVRDAPLAWLAGGRTLLRRLDRHDLVRRAFVTATIRANMRRPWSPEGLDGDLGDPIRSAWQAQENVIAGLRNQTANTLALSGQTWSAKIESLAQLASLGDLADPAHGRGALAREAATLLEDVARVAAGLHVRIGALDPTTRVAWARYVAPYDQPLDLHRLVLLPYGAEVAPSARLEIQALVNWLFATLHADVQPAVDLARDLVRVAILLASQAPVSDVVTGSLPAATTLTPGAVLNATVDTTRIRIGMRVAFGSAAGVGQGRVIDLADGAAVVQVLSLSGPSLALDTNAVVTFSEPPGGGASAR